MLDPSEIPSLHDFTPASPRQRAAHDRTVMAGATRDLVPVKVLEDIPHSAGWGGFVAGETAGFPQAFAQQLVDAGLASFDTDAGPKPPPRAPEMVLGALTARAGGDTTMRMVRPFGNLVEGDVAGFNAALANELRVKGIAVPVEEEPSPRITLKSVRNAIARRFR